MPAGSHLRVYIDMTDPCFDKMFLASEPDTCINRLADRGHSFLILTAARVVLLHRHEDVVNIDFHLLDKLDFKRNIVCDVLFFGFAFFTIFIV